MDGGRSARSVSSGSAAFKEEKEWQRELADERRSWQESAGLASTITDDQKGDDWQLLTKLPQPTEDQPYPSPLFNHEDGFRLPAHYDLHRLLPRQSALLGCQLLSEVLNVDLSLPRRVQAVVRYTLLPTTTYHAIISFLRQQPELPVNVIEALVRGCRLQRRGGGGGEQHARDTEQQQEQQQQKPIMTARAHSMIR